MTISNVALSDTFDVWRTRTNQLIVQYDETNTLAVNAYIAANDVSFTAANTTANLLSSNSQYLSIITQSLIDTGNLQNSITSNTQIRIQIYDNSNTIAETFQSNSTLGIVWNTANSALITAQSSFEKVNTASISANNHAGLMANSANAYAISVGLSANDYTDSQITLTEQYAVNISANTSAASNAYANLVGTSGNTYAASVGTSANVYAASVGVSANAYADSIGTLTPNVQTFTTNGTWGKPAGSYRFVRVQAWGAGGAGGRGGDASSTAGGGGGGAYVEKTVLIAEMNTTSTVVIGTGGAGVSTGSNITGAVGGNTTVTLASGSVTAYGGGGGEGDADGQAPAVAGGGGGTPFGVGKSGGIGDGSPVVTGDPLKFWDGGSGGFANGINNTAYVGENSIWGGAGGGSQTDGDGGAAGGSSLYGGDGGAGNETGVATNGSVPGGGGGGTGSGTSGSGANGKVIITTY